MSGFSEPGRGGLELASFTSHVPSRGCPFEPVTARFARGTCTAIKAPSGGGKTTLLRGLAGLIPHEGEARWGDHVLGGCGPAEWRAMVSYQPQRPVVYEGSVRENLERPFRYHVRQKAVPADLADRAKAWLARVDLKVDLDQSALALSEGERQRLCLVRTLLTEPPVWLLDEPTSALDEVRARQVGELLAERVRDGGCLLVVTHDLRWLKADTPVFELQAKEASHGG